jgi:Uncharacterised protein domain (DUF2415)
MCPSLRSPGQAARLQFMPAGLAEQLASTSTTSAMVILDDDPAWRAHRVWHTTQLELLNDPGLHQMLEQPPPASCIASTACIGPFPLAVNAAEPSPDGNWLAVLTDTMAVTLLPEALDFHPAASLCLDVDSRLRMCAPPSRALKDTAAHCRVPALMSRWHLQVLAVGWRLYARHHCACCPRPCKRTCMLSDWLPNLCRSPNHAHNTVGCQYATWHPASTYLAVSSDSHASVAVWRLLVPEAALGALALGAAVAKAVSDEGLNDEAVQQEQECIDDWNQQHPKHKLPSDAHARLTVKRAGAALWDRIQGVPVSAFEGHAHACLALAFVPAMPATLVWLEARSRIHIADVRGRAGAHQIIHAHALPAQIALAQPAACRQSPSAGATNGEGAYSTASWAAEDGGQAGADGAPAAAAQGTTDATVSTTIPNFMGTAANGSATAADGPQQDAKRPALAVLKQIDLRQGVEIVLRAWTLCNTREQHTLYSTPLPEPGPFPEYPALVRALWDLPEPGKGAWPPAKMAAQLRTFVRAVLQAESKVLKAPSIDQEESVTARVFDVLAKRSSPFTGLAVVGSDRVAVSSEQHLLTLSVLPQWAPAHPWPQPFLRAARTVLLIGKYGLQHARKECVGTLGLWSLPKDVVSRIVAKAAGDRLDWLLDGTTAGSAGAYHGLAKQQLTSAVVQKPLCQLHLRAGLRMFDPDCSAPLSYID